MTEVPRISHYECLGRLALGGMAEILLARVSGPNGFERPVVIKRILPHLASVSEFRQMFLDEARIVARIRDDNVVQVHELGTDGEELFLVMEYLEGESVGGLLRRLHSREEALDPWLACHIVAEAAAGLHTAHELTNDAGEPLGLVHRDISPQNVFITYAGRIKLLDFGIAKVADRSVRTATGQLKGKFQYMSPEQCLGNPLDRRSDVWALGVLLYELTTVSQPFKRANELLTFKAICEDPLPRPSQSRPDYPACLDPIVVRALSRDPDLRFATAKDLRRELLAAMRELEGSGEVGDSLAALMAREFGERRHEKHEMLTNATRGTEIIVPPAEVDEGVELPAITEMASSVVATRPASARRPHGRTAWWLAVAAVILLASVGVSFALKKEPRPASSERTAFTLGTSPPPSASTASFATAAPPASTLPGPEPSARPKLVAPRAKPRATATEPSSKARPPVQVPVW
jgi:serine/threonine-protein kinase